jgi:multiple sugar transport system substrate-binding protein
MIKKTLLAPLGILVILAMVLGACGPSETPTPEIVEVPVEITKIVEGEPITETIIVTATPEPVEPASAENPVELRIGVSMTAPELESWLPLIEALDQAHPEWILITEQTPQSSRMEKISANIAAGTLPDVQMMSGLGFIDYVLQDAFISLDEYITEAGIDMTDFFPYITEEWTVDGKLWGVPNTGAPNVLFFNKEKFDEANQPYPTNDWTYEDMAEAAIALTFDANGNTPNDADFDPENIVQWGYSGHPGPMTIWATDFISPLGGDLCADEGCTYVSMTDPEDLEALQYWYDLVVVNHAAPQDVFGGSSTGVPGDPFVNGFCAMGASGYFLIGQINATGVFDFGIVERPQGPTGERATSISTNGWAVAANSEYPEEAFKLIVELTSTDFLRDMWALPGHAVPSRRSAAQGILELEGADFQYVLNAMEYARGFRPNVPGAFEAYFNSLEYTNGVFAGTYTVEEGYGLAEEAANAVLQRE